MAELSFPFWGAEGEATKSLLGLSLFSCQSCHEPDELREAKLEKNSSTLFTTEKRSTRRCTENPDASVKSPCPPCLRGETGRLAAAGSRLNRSEPVAFPPKTTKAQRVVTIAFDDAASTNPSTKSSLPDLAFKTTLPVHSYALPLDGLSRQNHRNALSNEVTSWIPGITFRLSRSSFVMNRSIRVDAAQLS